MSQYFEGIMCKYECGFWKEHSAQHALISRFRKWLNNIDQGRILEALLTDLSKAFDCLPHNIFIAKLYAYGFDIKALDFIYAYLRKRKQKIKLDNGKQKTDISPGKIDYIWSSLRINFEVFIIQYRFMRFIFHNES